MPCTCSLTFWNAIGRNRGERRAPSSSGQAGSQITAAPRTQRVVDQAEHPRLVVPDVVEGAVHRDHVDRLGVREREEVALVEAEAIPEPSLVRTRLRLARILREAVEPEPADRGIPLRERAEVPAVAAAEIDDEAAAGIDLAVDVELRQHLAREERRERGLEHRSNQGSTVSRSASTDSRAARRKA